MPHTALTKVPASVGVVTLVAGAGLIIAPRPLARAARLGDRPGLARLFGLMDLVLVPGLLRASPRWPWMVARAVVNVPMAAAFRAETRRPGGEPGARLGMYALLALTTVDSGVAVALYRAERGPGAGDARRPRRRQGVVACGRTSGRSA